ncbi:MAG: hypothetical protein MUC34_21125 [Anaerolineae bacterium]|nr:hypothetical protein [Anaerolineae bacterium]
MGFGFTGNIVYDLHMIWRWVLLVVALVTLVKALLGKQPWTQLDDRLGLFFTVAIDIQFLLGMILWFVGPWRITAAGALMGNSLGRFMVIEHPLFLLISLVLAHIGRSRSRKAATDAGKHKNAFIFYLFSFLFIVLIFILRTTLG